jgi:aryl-alcohol dehydrogenase-like predicted oxidoreductase
MTDSTIELGKTSIKASSLGLGTWQWGDQMFWQYGKGYQESDVQAAFDASLEAGITFFDTAEVYGAGRSEKLLGAYARAYAEQAGAAPLVLATKFFPMPWRLLKGQLVSALRGSLQRMGLAQVDLYQVHWPFGPRPVETWADALADGVAAGLAKAVGVSNYTPELMRRSYLALKKRGVLLASNQVHYSLLNRKAEKNGLLALCQELGITLIAYSPLEKGILTGKYTPESLPPGLRSRSYGAAYLARVQPVIAELRRLGEIHGKTPGQVALNWAMGKGTLVIPGAKNEKQARENAGALGWALGSEEMADLDRISDSVSDEAPTSASLPKVST